MPGSLSIQRKKIPIGPYLEILLQCQTAEYPLVADSVAKVFLQH
jgi:hypothetical protein